MTDKWADRPKTLCYDSIGVLQIKLSTIVLAGQMFPAGIIVCPPTEHEVAEGYDWLDRSLGGQGYYSWSVYIPMENGFLVHIDRNHYGRKNPNPGWHWSMTLYSRTCSLRQHPPPDRDLYLPMFGTVVGHEIFTETKNFQGIACWNQCEEEWMVEMLERLGTMAAHHDVEGPQVEIRKLSEIEWEIPSQKEEP
jgi:hypothetical protein